MFFCTFFHGGLHLLAHRLRCIIIIGSPDLILRKELMKNQNFLDIILAGAGAVCGFLFGSLDGLLIALIALSLLDYVTGVIAAVINKTLSSAIGFKGICKKLFLFILVAVANIIDMQILGGAGTLRTAIIFVFVANEGLSIIENSAELGVPVPEKLKSVLAQLKQKGEDNDDKKGD